MPSQLPSLCHLCVKQLPPAGAAPLSNLAWTEHLAFNKVLPVSQQPLTTHGCEQGILSDAN